MPVCIRDQEIRKNHVIHKMKNVITIQPVGDACANVFLIRLLWRFRLPADPSGHIISGNQLVVLIGKISAAARLAGPAPIEMQCVLRVFRKPKLLVDHGGERLIDVLEPESDSRRPALDKMPAALPVYIIFFEGAGQGGIISDRSVSGAMGRTKRNPGAIWVLI